MHNNLRLLESQAFQAQKAGEYRTAINCWREIIETQSDWEHGYAHYNLADCYMRIREFDQAELAYRAALKLQPNDDLFSSALQSLIEARDSGLL